jgi:hypothetical protein
MEHGAPSSSFAHHHPLATTMTLHRLLFVHSVTFVLFLTLPNTSLSFSTKNPVEHFLENVLNRGAASTKEASPPSAEQGKALLNKLDIQSNTEPRPFHAELSQAPALLTASMPVRFVFLVARNSSRKHELIIALQHVICYIHVGCI